MKNILRSIALVLLMPLAAALAGEPSSLIEEKFDAPLSADWFWGLGTWNAKDGVLRGFESGPRRHGPVKMRKFPMKDGSVECEFRLERVSKKSRSGRRASSPVRADGPPACPQQPGRLFAVTAGDGCLPRCPRLFRRPLRNANVPWKKRVRSSQK